MTTGAQWRCTYCETWNLDSSGSCLVCERERSADAPSSGAPGSMSPSSAGRPTSPGSVGTVTPPPQPVAPSVAPPAAGYGAPLSHTGTPANVVYVVAEPTPASRWWLIPAILLAVGLLVVIGVIVGLLLTG